MMNLQALSLAAGFLVLVPNLPRDVGTAFSYKVKDEVIVGFHGRASILYLTAIGVYAMHKSPAPRPTSTHEAKIKNELICSMSTMALAREPGPWGACGGKPWDDGVFSTIKQVRIRLGELNVIYGLQFEYLKSDGKSVLSQFHGGTDENEIHQVCTMTLLFRVITFFIHI
ncbi:hypothetical protein M8C21_004799, partial [Ambrosia artemisiifolia]